MINNSTINVVLPYELKKNIHEKAKSKNISLNSLIRLIITEYLEKDN